MNTKQIASKIVSGLSAYLSNADLPAVRSVFVSGSYCRGDWLDSSSDLDITVILRDTQPAAKERDLQQIRSAIASITDGRPFPSQCPDGVDFGIVSDDLIPKTQAEARMPSPYPPFSINMFDLKAYHKMLYGDDINTLLPPPPSPAECATDCLRALSQRLSALKPDDTLRAMFLTYKAITAAQLHFGEPTLHKYRILELYQEHIPDFPEKCFGERVIRNYIGSFYPERPPEALAVEECKSFVPALALLTGAAPPP